MASNFFRSIGIPCTLYIDDRHNGQLQIPPNRGVYASLQTTDERNFEAAKAAIFVVAHYLIRLGYFLGLPKSILMPQKVVPYLGFQSDSTRQAFLLLPEKKNKLLCMVRHVLSLTRIPIKTLQQLAGKCVSLSITMPGALLFTVHGKCITLFPKHCDLLNLFQCTPHSESKLLIGYFWKHGTTHSLGATRSIFNSPLPLTHQLPGGVVCCCHVPICQLPIIGRNRNRAMILPQRKR